MSSSLNQVQNNNPSSDENNPLIDEILNEMNQQSENTDMDSEPNVNIIEDNSEPLNINSHTMDSNVDINNLQVPYNTETIDNNNTELDVPSPDAQSEIVTTVLHYIKRPIIVFILSFIVFSPFVTKYLAEGIPKLFSSVTAPHFQYIGTAIHCLILALIYAGAEQLL